MNRPRKHGESFRMYRASQNADEQKLRLYLRYGKLRYDSNQGPAKAVTTEHGTTYVPWHSTGVRAQS